MPPKKKSKDSAATTTESESNSGGDKGAKPFRSSDLDKEMLFTYMKGHHKVLYGNLDPGNDSHTKRLCQKAVLKYDSRGINRYSLHENIARQQSKVEPIVPRNIKTSYCKMHSVEKGA